MASSTNNLDHIIVWLDKNVAESDRYPLMKSAFRTTVNPESVSQTSIIGDDLSNNICDERTDQEANSDSNPFGLKLFDDLDKCYKFLLANAGKKRIFFITSGALGQYIVPKLLNKDPQVFQDKNGKLYEHSIYIFCAHMAAHAEWAQDFLDLNCIQMEHDEQIVLFWLTRDIANYFVTKGKEELTKTDIATIKQAYQDLTWGRSLYVKANSVKKGLPIDALLTEIDKLIVEAENKIKESED
ncbi:unnamed protein product [Rotaria magnacalcarata]|uniref:Uncharacterized protein n=1 Tax=Rotaria magnacalcarata TaxID=392030 RepID=A0A816Y509_9BILA|nr:unnamed protein product [Rotaria magnacalcarata]CAF2100053.1 unnamed protein product [Rotaria magnacalcarata]CAF2154517.1 unnamed protein product [Rotaria magnacalcarata]CAF3917539.1 unnamed protein product [Rotaria magnacalcarata]CAF4105372.1 unnamed protein product [Rotaria magnacalcarata]